MNFCRTSKTWNSDFYYIFIPDVMAIDNKKMSVWSQVLDKSITRIEVIWGLQKKCYTLHFYIFSSLWLIAYSWFINYIIKFKFLFLLSFIQSPDYLVHSNSIIRKILIFAQSLKIEALILVKLLSQTCKNIRCMLAIDKEKQGNISFTSIEWNIC